MTREEALKRLKDAALDRNTYREGDWFGDPIYDEFRDDESFVIEAMEFNPFIFDYATERIKDILEIRILSLESYDRDGIEYNYKNEDLPPDLKEIVGNGDAIVELKRYQAELREKESFKESLTDILSKKEAKAAKKVKGI